MSKHLGMPAKPIPIAAAKQIAEAYGYDQVVIYARSVDEGEHLTTYGVTKIHCHVAKLMADKLKAFMGWNAEVVSE